MDPYHSAAMLSLGGIKSFVFARQALARNEFSAMLAVQKKKDFYSPETQHLRRVIRVNTAAATLTQMIFGDGKNRNFMTKLSSQI